MPIYRNLICLDCGHTAPDDSSEAQFPHVDGSAQCPKCHSRQVRFLTKGEVTLRKLSRGIAIEHTQAPPSETPPTPWPPKYLYVNGAEPESETKVSPIHPAKNIDAVYGTQLKAAAPVIPPPLPSCPHCMCCAIGMRQIVHKDSPTRFGVACHLCGVTGPADSSEDGARTKWTEWCDRLTAQRRELDALRQLTQNREERIRDLEDDLKKDVVHRDRLKKELDQANHTVTALLKCKGTTEDQHLAECLDLLSTIRYFEEAGNSTQWRDRIDKIIGPRASQPPKNQDWTNVANWRGNKWLGQPLKGLVDVLTEFKVQYAAQFNVDLLAIRLMTSDVLSLTSTTEDQHLAECKSLLREIRRWHWDSVKDTADGTDWIQRIDKLIGPPPAPAPKVHMLKCVDPHFGDLKLGKNMELRKDDRGFQVGDILGLMHYIPPDIRECQSHQSPRYSGQVLWRKVTHILRSGVGSVTGAIKDGYCILSVDVVIIPGNWRELLAAVPGFPEPSSTEQEKHG